MYKTLRSGHFFVVRWTQTPTHAAATSLFEDIEAARVAADRPLSLVVIIPAGRVDAPPPDVRKYMQDHMPRVFGLCSSVDAVVLGDGVFVTLMRTGLRAMTMALRTPARLSILSSEQELTRTQSVPADVLAMVRTAQQDVDSKR